VAQFGPESLAQFQPEWVVQFGRNIQQTARRRKNEISHAEMYGEFDCPQFNPHGYDFRTSWEVNVKECNLERHTSANTLTTLSSFDQCLPR
jgi:hypothetical protein